MACRFNTLLKGLPALFLALSTHAGTLIVESSDQHASYDRLETFVQHVNALADDYKRRDPTGKIVLLFNGDFTGSSTWSRGDRGWLAYRVLQELSQKYQLVFVPGNHDGLDWGKHAGGNELFTEQLKALKNAGVPVLAANLKPGKDGRAIFSGHYDVTDSSGEKTRFVGLALEDLFKQSNYQPDARVKPIAKEIPSVQAITTELTQAKKDGIRRMVLSFHESTKKTKAILEQITPLAKSLGIEIPVVFTAHDHLPVSEKVGDMHLANGGADFNFATVEFGQRGAVSEVRLHQAGETQTLPKRSQRRSPALKALAEHVARVRKEEGQVLTRVPEYKETRADFIRERTRLGTLLSDTLADWAQSQLPKTGLPADTPIVALYNSTSYRGNTSIAAGDFTRGDVRAIYPYENSCRFYQASGEEIERSVRAVRKYMGESLGAYSPQLSSNLRENSTGGLEILDEGGQWHPLEPGKKYGLVMDAWLSENGFRLPEMKWANDPTRILAQELHQDVLLQFAPHRLGSPAAANLRRCIRAVQEALEKPK